ncbi:MAG: hypothetical protein IPM96_13590 [Ignavibacteria bacterium]|nr:hypothetical protein [Ignavibacteria bacterium]
MAKVTVLDIDGVETSYSTYLAARNDIINSSIQRPLIQIWANLNEQIVLLTGADIWIAPGVVIDQDPLNPGVTITDNNQAVECTIYGYGVINNTGSSSCISVVHSGSKLSVDCDDIKNVKRCCS